MSENTSLISQVPSGFKQYPDNSPFKIRKYTLGELKILSNLSTLREKYDLILSGITGPVRDNLDLTLYDANFLGIQRKLLTFGQNSIKIASYCPNCGKVVEDAIETNDIAFYDVDAPELPLNVTLHSGTVISFGLITLRSYLDLLDKNDNPNWDELMATQCVSHPYDEAYRIITEEASIEDLPVLDKVDEILYHGTMPITIHCGGVTYEENPESNISFSSVESMTKEELLGLASDHGLGISTSLPREVLFDSIVTNLDIARIKRCNYQRLVHLGAGDHFVVPFRRDEGSIDSAISFGKVREHTAE